MNTLPHPPSFGPQNRHLRYFCFGSIEKTIMGTQSTGVFRAQARPYDVPTSSSTRRANNDNARPSRQKDCSVIRFARLSLGLTRWSFLDLTTNPLPIGTRTRIWRKWLTLRSVLHVAPPVLDTSRS
ncbi:hypothetical protein GALMADRAFT_1139183 [Galerina marginata CBS 339.88]|uniref:Uncharacterized protein n=1 Tax=Galerina marginata (strain CBS 339.88) TaxID=685588 RepID=A0A067S7A3_GALM3|nr:hypothetical protein GALMADRAFT_1139183 [Galerina marginata CBS 339.88]